jgi:glycosyltransferase involved in cell wall biosynthesis
MKLSVIIPCLNAADTIAVQLEALASQGWSEPWEVIVSDNGSTDVTLKIVERYREHLPNLRIVNSSDRRGAAHARNVGVLAATGDAFLFCDADDEVAQGWLAAMGEAVFRHDFVTCRLDSEKLNTPWLQKSWKNAQRDGPIQFHPPYLPFGGSFSIGVKRSLHEAIGGFDESVFGVEDIDYCWKIQLAGTKLHFVSHTAVYYRYPKEFGRMYSQMRGIGENSAFLYKRYQPLGMPMLSQTWKTAIIALISLLIKLPRIRSKQDLAAWVRAFGLRMGRLQGSIKHRVMYI